MPVSRAYSQSTQRQRVERRGIGSSLKSKSGGGAMGVSCQKYANSAVFSATLVFERRFSKKWGVFAWASCNVQVLTDKECTCNCCIREQRPWWKGSKLKGIASISCQSKVPCNNPQKKNLCSDLRHRKDVPPLYHNLQLVFSRDW